MKKTFLLLSAGFVLALGCNKSSNSKEDQPVDETEFTATQRNCSSHDVLVEQLKADPSLQNRLCN
jgi:hypothetical protein